MRLVQLSNGTENRVAVVKGEHLQLLSNFSLIFDFLSLLIDNPSESINNHVSKDQLTYDDVYNHKNEWKIEVPVIHPEGPMNCLVSGTGLTHKASAKNREAMHAMSGDQEKMTDSMKMYLMGEEGGKPGEGTIGVQPEWFYKGNGTILRPHGAALQIPSYARDGGEEAEIAAVYIIDSEGSPVRVGFCQGNEFSDHIMEKENYLYLAPSKLRECAIGPELIMDQEFFNLQGEVSIFRNTRLLWSKSINSGEKNMAHSLSNLEYHHFKYEQHRVPGQLHLHFLGADAFSFGEDIHLEDGDQMQISFNDMGKPLINTLKHGTEKEKEFSVRSVGME